MLANLVGGGEVISIVLLAPTAWWWKLHGFLTYKTQVLISPLLVLMVCELFCWYVNLNKSLKFPEL